MKFLAQCLFGVTVFIVLQVSVCEVVPLADDDDIDDDPIDESHRTRRAAPPTIANRTACNPGDDQPATRVITSERLAKMRQAMRDQNIQGFFIPHRDDHGYYHVTEHDDRQRFISGFSASGVWVAVTLTKAALWAYPSDVPDAEDTLDCNWILMKTGQPGVPSFTKWLSDNLEPESTVGFDAFSIRPYKYLRYGRALNSSNIRLKFITDNPVDKAWGSDRPPPPSTDINCLELKHAGKSWQNKVDDVFTTMHDQNFHGGYVITQLDEIAWLFNFRASDIPLRPVPMAYAILECGEDEVKKATLYIHDKNDRLTREPSDSETFHKLYEHLNTSKDGQCINGSWPCVQVREYDRMQVLRDEIAIVNGGGDVWLFPRSSFAVIATVPMDKRREEESIIELAKAQKNEVERQGMENCYMRDSLAIIEFLAKIDNDIRSGEREWDEMSAAEELDRMKTEVDMYRGMSMNTISAFAEHSSTVVYYVTPRTNRNITKDSMYMVDAGSQYIDGTTDMSRTMHYGEPTPYQIDCYTRALMGAIDLLKMVWPNWLYGRDLDILSRQAMWQVGLDFSYLSSYGIGYYLNLHEGPAYVSLHHWPFSKREKLLPGMVMSAKHGFHEYGNFGLRLESTAIIEPAETKYSGNGTHLQWNTITLVPYEPNLIDYSLLSPQQIAWLNDYNMLIKSTMEKKVSKLAKQWLKERTRPIQTSRNGPA